MQERLELLRVELAVRDEHLHVPIGIGRVREADVDVQNLGDRVVRVRLGVFVPDLGDRVREGGARPAPAGLHDVELRLRHQHVEGEEPTGGEVRPHAFEEALHVHAAVQVLDRVERADDEREAPAQPEGPHVAFHEAQAPGEALGEPARSLPGVGEHLGARVEPDQIDEIVEPGRS